MAVKILESLRGDSDVTLRNATSTLLSNRVQFLDEALRDNPTGPVQMLTDIDHTQITYEVVVGSLADGDRGKARTIWRHEVVFGQTDRTVAGGTAFVEAARAQEQIAWALLTLIRRGAMEDHDR